MADNQGKPQVEPRLTQSNTSIRHQLMGEQFMSGHH